MLSFLFTLRIETKPMPSRKDYAWNISLKSAALSFPFASFLLGTVSRASRSDSLQPAAAPLVT